MARVVWIEEFKNGIEFEIGPNYDNDSTRSQTSDWLSRLAARSRKGQVLGSKPGWERLSFCTSGAGDGCCQNIFQGSAGNIWQLNGGWTRLYLILHWRLGHVSVLTRTLGGDGAPACATNFSKQDDRLKVIRTPPGGGS